MNNPVVLLHQKPRQYVEILDHVTITYSVRYWHSQELTQRSPPLLDLWSQIYKVKLLYTLVLCSFEATPE
jgi:hypothetical protein